MQARAPPGPSPLLFLERKIRLRSEFRYISAVSLTPLPDSAPSPLPPSSPPIERRRRSQRMPLPSLHSRPSGQGLGTLPLHSTGRIALPIRVPRTSGDPPLLGPNGPAAHCRRAVTLCLFPPPGMILSARRRSMAPCLPVYMSHPPGVLVLRWRCAQSAIPSLSRVPSRSPFPSAPVCCVRCVCGATADACWRSCPQYGMPGDGMLGDSLPPSLRLFPSRVPYPHSRSCLSTTQFVDVCFTTVCD
jgi:hypothetical protein